jgi:hypothetical protein
MTPQNAAIRKTTKLIEGKLSLRPQAQPDPSHLMRWNLHAESAVLVVDWHAAIHHRASD